MRHYVVRHADGIFYIIEGAVNLTEYSALNHIVLNRDGFAIWFGGDYNDCKRYIEGYSWWNECKELNNNDAEDCMKAFNKEFQLRLSDKHYADEYNNQIVVPLSSIQDILIEMGVRK